MHNHSLHINSLQNKMKLKEKKVIAQEILQFPIHCLSLVEMKVSKVQVSKMIVFSCPGFWGD